MKNIYFFAILLQTFFFNCNGVTIDVASKYRAINYNTIKSAIEEAKNIFKRSPNTVVIIKLRAGKHYITPPSKKRPIAIEFTGTKHGPHGRLIFEGAGRSHTVVVVPIGFLTFRGRGVERLTIRHMTLTRDKPLVSQGRVEQTGKGFVILKIDSSFPDPTKIFDYEWKQGKYLKKYNYANGRCTINQHNNPQVAYSRVDRLGGGRFKFTLSLKHFNKNTYWRRGQMIGIKSKCCNDIGRMLYWFYDGKDIVLENLRFHRVTRGVMRGHISNIHISNILIRKESPNWCLSSSGGGPQIGQPEDPPVDNVVVNHVVAEGTGDDSVALFNVKSGVVSNCNIKDSFARGILLNNSPNVRVYGNKMTRNPLMHCKAEPCPEA